MKCGFLRVFIDCIEYVQYEFRFVDIIRVIKIRRNVRQ